MKYLRNKMVVKTNLTSFLRGYRRGHYKNEQRREDM
jgi:hypothetical protein